MNGRIDVIHEGIVCWSIVEKDGKFSLECDNKMFGMKELSKEEQEIIIKTTIDTFFNKK